MDLNIPEKHRAPKAAREKVARERGVKGEAPRTAFGVRVTREGVKDVEAGLHLVDDYLVSQMTGGHEIAAPLQ